MCIWRDYDVKTWVACLVNYAGVFNDGIHLNTLKTIMRDRGESFFDDQSVVQAIEELKDEGLIISEQNYV